MVEEEEEGADLVHVSNFSNMLVTVSRTVPFWRRRTSFGCLWLAGMSWCRRRALIAGDEFEDWAQAIEYTMSFRERLSRG